MKKLVFATIVAAGILSPALAQNGLHAYALVGTRAGSGVHSFAMTPGDPPAAYPENPAATGGGSTGFNIRVLQH